MSSSDNRQPEEIAREHIDQLLRLAGWAIQDRKKMDIAAARGVAVREFPIPGGEIDYLLYVDRKVIGAIEAKKFGETLSGVEPQSKRYSEGFQAVAAEKGYPFWELPLPFHYISTGIETVFVDLRDPAPRPRDLFAFHTPDALATWVGDGSSLRKRLQLLPPLIDDGLRPVQAEAITSLERSLASAKPRALIKMSGGAGKTFVGAAETYRLLKFGGARRILFLVDRRSLGKQAYDEFTNWITPDDGRKFGEIYNIQLLRSNTIDPAASVVITTLQRLYSILRGEADTDDEIEESSLFELEAGADQTPVEVSYRPELPVEMFDFTWIDECHRSIYGKYGQVLDYFDSFKTGLSATPTGFTYGYFNGNVVTDYSYEQSVIDGINVDFSIYRIKTEITEGGSKIAKGEPVRLRDRATRKPTYLEQDEDLAYDEAKLDRQVVAPDQIRLIVKTFKEKLPEIFPGRKEVPKTIIFCKDDSHAEDVLKIVREVFDADWNFAQKITYKSQGNTDDLIRDMRNDPRFRIAVTVDQISTGTDIKVIECLIFMRYVRSRTHFDQMKYRGVRTIDPTDLKAVTGSADEKTHFVLVDCVGISDNDHAWADTKPLDNSAPTVPLKKLLEQIAMGSSHPELLTTIAARLSRLDKRLSDAQQAEISKTVGTTLKEVATALVEAADPNKAELAAHAALPEDPAEAAKVGEAIEVEGVEVIAPTAAQIAEAQQKLIDAAVAPLLKPDVRQAIATLQTTVEQIIHIGAQDALLYAGPVDRGGAEEVVKTFKEFIEHHKDEHVALQALFAAPYRRRLTLSEIKKLAEAIKAPPYFLTPEKVWEAYEKIEAAKVKGHGGKIPADLVSLLRFALEQDDELVPHKEVVRLRFDLWLQDQGGPEKFSAEQLRWLEMVRDHMEESITIEKDDFDLDPFIQEGGIVAARRAFGAELEDVLDQLNESLVAA
jgi:type I restriction enzyme, R subunit